MRKPAKFFSIFGLIRGIIVGSTIASKLAASIVPIWTVDQNKIPDKWVGLRGEIEKPNGPPLLNPDIIELLNQSDLINELESVVRLSYAMASASELKALDEYWIETLIRRTSSTTMTQYLAIRAVLDTVPANTEDYYLARWSRKSGNTGQDCDSGST